MALKTAWQIRSTLSKNCSVGAAAYLMGLAVAAQSAPYTYTVTGPAPNINTATGLASPPNAGPADMYRQPIGAASFNIGPVGGQIWDGTVLVGIWTLTDWNATALLNGSSWDTGFTTADVAPFPTPAGVVNNNYPGVTGIGLTMRVNTSSDGQLIGGGTTQFGYSVQATITNPGYVVEGVTILGRNPNNAGMWSGPNTSVPTGKSQSDYPYPLGTLAFSNFGGVATLTNPVVATLGHANLNGATDGAAQSAPWVITPAFSVGDGLSPPPATATAANPSKPYDWTAPSTYWKLSSSAGNTMTYSADYGGRGSAQEGSAFSFNIVRAADMSATLSSFPPNAPAGQTVTGTLTCTNEGPGDAIAPRCAVTGLPQGATVTCTPDPAPATLAVGASMRCAVTYTQPASGDVTVVGTAGAQNDTNPANNVATQVIGTPQPAIPQPVPTLGELAQMLLVMLMAWLGVAALRARAGR